MAREWFGVNVLKSGSVKMTLEIALTRGRKEYQLISMKAD